MKGFPNQVPDLRKLARGLAVIEALNGHGGDSKSYDALGEALVRAGVLGTGHTPLPVEHYLTSQREKRPSDQSHQTGARGLRELYRLLGLIDDAGPRVELTDAGERVASFAGAELDEARKEYWRRTIRNLSHDGGDGASSHPYQVLLRLVERVPGITRAKCALALEARDDSDDELDRIVRLAALDEAQIRRSINVTESNWNNAKKMLPKFAELLDDVTKTGGRFHLAIAPGQGAATAAPGRSDSQIARPRQARRVNPQTIATAATADSFDEVQLPLKSDPAALAFAIQLRRERLRRHNVLVREIATRYYDAGMQLFEGRFDCLASNDLIGLLNEVKTLDGSRADEESQVREAIGQLLYYEPFVRRETGGGVIHKIAVFESPISDDHVGLLHELGIVSIWKQAQRFVGGPGADELLSSYFGNL